jgi:hypothetical protein
LAKIVGLVHVLLFITLIAAIIAIGIEVVTQGSTETPLVSCPRIHAARFQSKCRRFVRPCQNRCQPLAPGTEDATQARIPGTGISNLPEAWLIWHAAESLRGV